METSNSRSFLSRKVAWLTLLLLAVVALALVLLPVWIIQQVTGEAILGPLKSQRLTPVFHDELTFATWKREKPQGRVLRPDEEIARAGKYAPANWEERMATVPAIGGPLSG